MAPNSFYQAGTLFTHEEKMVLGYCGDGRYIGFGISHFWESIMAAFKHADTSNFDRLSIAFRDLSRAWILYRGGYLTAREELSEHAAKTLDADTPPWWTVSDLRAGAIVMVQEGESVEDVWTAVRELSKANWPPLALVHSGDPGDEHPSAA